MDSNPLHQPLETPGGIFSLSPFKKIKGEGEERGFTPVS